MSALDQRIASDTMGLKIRTVRTQPSMQRGQKGVLLSDPLAISDKALFIPGTLALLLELMDGTRDVGTLRTGFELRTGIPLNHSTVEQLVSQLDEALFLENERFAEAYGVALKDYHTAFSRSPTLAGSCYPADANELSVFLQRYLDQAEDDGIEPPGDVKGLICPHIDYERGGPIYAKVWAKTQAAVKKAELVVILGTDHSEGEGSVTLTRQDYATPWGVIPTAQDVVDELANKIGETIFEHELNHRREHSIEAALIWLHYVLGDRTCHLLPILCGSLDSFLKDGRNPLEAPHIASTIEMLRILCSHKRSIIVAAGDLAHVGPAFGDPYPVDLAGRARMTTQDQRLLDIMSGGKAEDLFTEILNERNRRHVCGFAPIYLAMSVLGVKGTLLGYEQCPASADGDSLVSICGMLY